MNDIDSLNELTNTHGGILTLSVMAALLALLVGGVVFTILADRRDRLRDHKPSQQDLTKFINRYATYYNRTLDSSILTTHTLDEWVRIYRTDTLDGEASAPLGFWRRLAGHLRFAMRNNHSWVAIFFRPLTSYRRTERYVIAFSIMFGSMAANALFYQFGENESFFDVNTLLTRFVAAILSSLIVFVPTTIMGTIFRHTRPRYEPSYATEIGSSDDILKLQDTNYVKWSGRCAALFLEWSLPWWFCIISYIVLGLSSALCIYLTLLYGGSFSDVQAVAWIQSFFVSVALSIVLLQTAKAFALALWLTVSGKPKQSGETELN